MKRGASGGVGEFASFFPLSGGGRDVRAIEAFKKRESNGEKWPISLFAALANTIWTTFR